MFSYIFQHFWDRGNQRRPSRPNRATYTAANIVDDQRRWIAFCQHSPSTPDWKALLKTLTWENRDLAESFCRYLMRREESGIGTLSTIRLYIRQLSVVYWKYTGTQLEKRIKDHNVIILKTEIAPKFALRVEPKQASPISRIFDGSETRRPSKLDSNDWTTHLSASSSCGPVASDTCWCLASRRTSRRK